MSRYLMQKARLSLRLSVLESICAEEQEFETWPEGFRDRMQRVIYQIMDVADMPYLVVSYMPTGGLSIEHHGWDWDIDFYTDDEHLTTWTCGDLYLRPPTYKDLPDRGGTDD